VPFRGHDSHQPSTRRRAAFSPLADGLVPDDQAGHPPGNVHVLDFESRESDIPEISAPNRGERTWLDRHRHHPDTKRIRPIGRQDRSDSSFTGKFTLSASGGFTVSSEREV
jgi:hypothetical protein